MIALRLDRTCGHYSRTSSSPPPHKRSSCRVRFCSSSTTQSVKMEAPPAKVVTVRAVEATPESFAPFGQVIVASPDGEAFGPRDAQLDLSRGIPRFYIMRLENRQLKFSDITHHASVTQCLGAIGGQDWYLGVAKPSVVDEPSNQSPDGRKPVLSRGGHYFLPPNPDEVCVFRVSGPKFLKLHKGTWHAGPLFMADAMDFYNLELSNTNVVDHTTHNFKRHDGVTFVIED